jgi:hypothetical protein
MDKIYKITTNFLPGVNREGILYEIFKLLALIMIVIYKY